MDHKMTITVTDDKGTILYQQTITTERPSGLIRAIEGLIEKDSND